MPQTNAEAPEPGNDSGKETVRYIFDETMRRARQSTAGLDDELINVDPGNGAMSIGAILKHEADLVRFMTETLEPGSCADLEKAPGAERFCLETLDAARERLGQRFLEVWLRTPAETLLSKRPDLPPKSWAEWPVLMRVLRPLTDFATHVGQVNYARRQLGNPVTR